MKPQLLIFARQPVLGRVKTRLAADIGDEAALAVYRELLSITAEAVTAAKQPATVWLADAPTPPPAALPEWPSLPWQPQAAGDLGQRMTAAFAHAFASGATAVAIIGTDCPGLRASHLTQAFALLAAGLLLWWREGDRLFTDGLIAAIIACF